MYCGDKGKSYPLTLKNIYQLLQLANKFWNEYDEDYEYVDDSELVNEYDLYRDFFNILFDIIGKYYPFVKDIKKYLYDKRTEYVIPMKFEDAFIYHNWAEYFNKYQNAKKIHVKFNMIHPNGSYWLIKSISYIKKEDIGLLENFVKDDQCYENKDLWYFMHSRESIKSFLCCYYKNKLNILHNSDYEKYLVLRDFIEMSFLLKKKISLRHNSFNKIQEEESVLATKYQLKNMEEIKIPQKSKFNRLRTILPQEFEWITQKKRLAEETQMQHNCVWSYSKKINRDKCAIYSYVENQKRYTIEFGARRGKYYIAQIYGVCNSDCPDNIEQYVKELIA
jgi:hypothetical protein